MKPMFLFIPSQFQVSLKKKIKGCQKYRGLLSHLMRWILPKQTEGSVMESEQQENILKSREAAVGGGLRLVWDVCLVLASDCEEEQGLSCNHFSPF